MHKYSGSKYDLLWRDYQKGYGEHKTGSNCYSFGVHDFRKNRPHKSVPGNVTEHVLKDPKFQRLPGFPKFLAQYRRNPFSDSHDWRTCSESVKRLLSDGRASVLFHAARGVDVGAASTMRGPFQKMDVPSRPDERSFAMVVDSGKESAFPGSTDFHFYARYRVPVEDLYRMKMVGHSTRTNSVQNVYSELGLNPFMSDWQLSHRLDPGHPMLDPVRRAYMNMRLHADRFPDYALGVFPDPWWIFNARKGDMNRVRRMHRELKASCLDRKDERCLKVINMAKAQCARGTGRYHGSVGLWAHKSGWATGAQNADGGRYLIFNPRLASRKHGSSGYAYDTFCGFFKIKQGLGVSSP